MERKDLIDFLHASLTSSFEIVNNPSLRLTLRPSLPARRRPRSINAKRDDSFAGMASVLKRSTADDAEPLPKRLKSSPSKVVSLESLLSNPSDYLSPPVTGVSESKHIFGDVHDLRYNPGGKILSLTLRSSMGEKAAGTTSLLEVAIDFQGQWTSEAYAAWKDLEGAHMYLHAPGGVVQEQKEGEKGQPLKLIYKAASGRLGCTRNGEKIDRIFNYKTATCALPASWRANCH